MTTHDDTSKFLLRRSVIKAASALLLRKAVVNKRTAEKDVELRRYRIRAETVERLSKIDDERILCMVKHLVVAEGQMLARALNSATRTIASIDQTIGQKE